MKRVQVWPRVPWSSQLPQGYVLAEGLLATFDIPLLRLGQAETEIFGRRPIIIPRFARLAAYRVSEVDL